MEVSAIIAIEIELVVKLHEKRIFRFLSVMASIHQPNEIVLADVERLQIKETTDSEELNLNEFLAKFSRLCHLEIQKNDTIFKLDLPASVKTIHFDASFDDVYVCGMKLRVNAPQLQNVYCSVGIRNIDPSSISEAFKHRKFWKF